MSIEWKEAKAAVNFHKYKASFEVRNNARDLRC